MCVVALSYLDDPRWPIVLVGNRDEFHDRPASPLGMWHEPHGVIAGRDLRSGGTWLGITPERLAVVTNLRGFGGPDPARPSRGALVTDALSGRLPADRGLVAYNPFNLLMIEAGGGTLLTNRPAARRFPLTPGRHGMANGPLDEPCARVAAARGAIDAWLAGATPDHDDMLDRFGPDAAQGAAALFVRDRVYGTRCTTMVTIDRAGNGRISERRYEADGRKAGETTIDFHWPGADHDEIVIGQHR